MKKSIFLLSAFVLFFNFSFLSGTNALTKETIISEACPDPIINLFSPSSGPINTEITVTGSDFTSINSVDFNGINATFSITNDTEILVTVPAGVSNTSNITLTTSGGCSVTTASSYTLIDSDCDTASEIYISEAYDSDGGSYGVIELYNPTNTTISLSPNYEVIRYGDIGDTSSSTVIPLIGSIAPFSTYIIEMGSTGNTCSGLSADVTIAAGINEDDELNLVKNGSVIDVLYTDDEIGFTFIRNADAAAPSTTYNANEWLLLEDEDCSNLGSHTATGGSSSSITQPINQTICENGTTNFSVSVTTGTYTYQWLVLNDSGNWVNVTNDSNYSGATSNTLTISNVPETFNGYQYYCILTATGCELISNAAQLEVSNPEVDTLPNQIECSGYTLPALTNGNYFTGTNGSGAQLSAGNAVSSSLTIYIYNEVGTGSNICSNESSFNVTIVGTPDVDTLSNQSVCSEYTLPTLTDGNYFTGTNGSGTPLNTGDTISTSQTIYIYNEIGTAPDVCSNESSFNITIIAAPDVDTLSDQSVCSEYTLPTLTNGNYYTGTSGSGTLLNAGTTISTSQLIYIYNEVGTAPNTCSNESSFQITIYPSVAFTLDASNFTINDDTITVTMTDTSINYEYAIDDSSFQTDNEFSNISGGTHTLYVQDSNGCVVESISFEIPSVPEDLIIPSGFSPNNDGKNDWFNIQGLYDVYPNHKLEIYNRYGTLVFQGNNDNKWYGIANKGILNSDNVLPVGTYFYILNLNNSNSDSEPIAGWIYLNK